jgi:hypothetical protein
MEVDEGIAVYIKHDGLLHLWGACMIPPSTPSTPSQRSRDGPVSTIRNVIWMPNREMDRREWAAAGRQLGEITRCNQWWVGDWLCYGSKRWGEKYVDASRITGYDVSSLRNMAWIASRFVPSRRRETLSWSHHVVVAPLEPQFQDEWLEVCISRRLSVADLRVELRRLRSRESSFRGRKMSTSVCDSCGRTVVASGTKVRRDGQVLEEAGEVNI